MSKYAHFSERQPIATAFALALGAAISLGLARFSYALFLPIMREDLGWSYLIAGTMNTANAGGYFLGALLCPRLFKWTTPSKIFIISALLTSLLLGLSGTVSGTYELFLLRLFAGIFSAFVFVGGGILSAQLGSMHHLKSGLVLGIYYGGTGIGIVLSSLIIPTATHWAASQEWAHSWQLGWWVLAFIGFLFSLILIKPSLSIHPSTSQQNINQPAAISSYGKIILGYCCFGMGYIGYMTFIVALLKQMGMTNNSIYLFYGLLGISVMISSKIWAKMLDIYKGGSSLGILNGLLAFASFLPAIIAINLQRNELLSLTSICIIYLSGIIFGGCFLSAVAATTAFVKHNLPQQQWVSGITVFTTVFAIGQVIGPTLTGWIADKFGSLTIGFLISSCILLIGSVVAFIQKPLSKSTH